MAFYIENTIHALHRKDLDVRSIESLWVEISMKSNNTVLVGGFYRPPNSEVNAFSLIEHSLDQAVDTEIENIVILGDFNEDYLKPNNDRVKHILTKYDMIQFISEPTYFTENSNSCLDLVIANNRKTVDFVHVGPSI